MYNLFLVLPSELQSAGSGVGCVVLAQHHVVVEEDRKGGIEVVGRSEAGNRGVAVYVNARDGEGAGLADERGVEDAAIVEELMPPSHAAFDAQRAAGVVDGIGQQAAADQAAASGSRHVAGGDVDRIGTGFREAVLLCLDVFHG
jgi:hypothetical protein